MAGVYIHIPFCKQACNYCDFHFSTSLKNKKALVQSILKEIEFRNDFFTDTEYIQTIYFGGGTPSLLDQSELFDIINQLAKYFKIASNPEITLEANPDDINSEKLKEWKQASINRLSIGVQSFNETHLRYMNRAHNSLQAINSIISSQEAGFDNITIDLIYGFPELSDEQWVKNIETACSFEVPHISAYCMTVEPKTALSSAILSGKKEAMNEEQAAKQFEILTRILSQYHYEQYEISNFCKIGKYSKHNSNYWKGEKYIGIGPSAHSFNGDMRLWNISNNALYINGVNQKDLKIEHEILTIAQRYNEYILTSLRTKWGTDIELLNRSFGEQFEQFCLDEANKYIKSAEIIRKNNHLYLSEAGKLFADKIASDLFFVGD